MSKIMKLFYNRYKNKQSRDRSRQMLLNLISGVQKQFLQAHGYLYNSVITPPKIWPASSKLTYTVIPLVSNASLV